jgi:hypothetical protein
MTARSIKTPGTLVSADQVAYAVAYHDLNCWKKAMFEKLGWMLLHQRDDRPYKISAYREDIRHLSLAIDEKLRITTDVDRRNDLLIMQRNVATLRERVGDIFGKRSAASRSK